MACADVREPSPPRGWHKRQQCVQVSTLQTGPRPNYNSTIQYVVPMDAPFLRYLSATSLRLELNQVRHQLGRCARCL